MTNRRSSRNTVLSTPGALLLAQHAGLCLKTLELGNWWLTVHQYSTKPKGTGKLQRWLLWDYRQTPHCDRVAAARGGNMNPALRVAAYFHLQLRSRAGNTMRDQTDLLLFFPDSHKAEREAKNSTRVFSMTMHPFLSILKERFLELLSHPFLF